jgi:bifunctional non-homologous end joining protein LigD
MPQNAAHKRNPAGKRPLLPVKIKRSALKKKAIPRKAGKTGSGKAITDLSIAPEAKFPKSISPMLATLVDQPVEEEGWFYEVKWDGYRAVALCKKQEVDLISRNQKSFNDKFYPIYDALKKTGWNAVLDGEIVVLKNSGISSFGDLQNWRSESDGELFYYVFDLLWLEGHSLLTLPLFRRREILTQILPKDGSIRESPIFKTGAKAFLGAAADMGLEGMIAKRSNSLYLPGRRSADWLKIKVQQRHEVVIGGFTKNEDSPKVFSSLLVGVYENGKLQYTGKIGTGFNEQQQKKMLSAFRPLITARPAFQVIPDINKPSRFRPDPPVAKAIWLKPELVCEVSYTEITGDGIMRHPSFKGMREDKKAKDVHREISKPLREVIAVTKSKKPGTTGKSSSPKEAVSPKILKPIMAAGRKSLLNPTEETQVKTLRGRQLKFGNLSKKYWPKEGFSKRDMLNYYYQVAPYILPYLKDRPQSLNRFPNGITGKSFYQKDVTATAPEWVKQFPYHTSVGEDKNFLVVQDEADLLWMANLGAIEMNPWNSTIYKPDHPDWCIIDLDPTEKNSFDQVIKTAQVTKTFLDSIKVPGYCKTSGSTGIHIYIPMGARYHYDECQLFGKIIASHVHEELPDFTSIERMTGKRKGKIYVDYLQNRPKATLAAPYSVRPKPGATVSMPLHWEEVKKGLSMKNFNIKNALDRIKNEGDLFKPVLGKGISLKKILDQYAL